MPFMQWHKEWFKFCQADLRLFPISDSHISINFVVHHIYANMKIPFQRICRETYIYLMLYYKIESSFTIPIHFLRMLQMLKSFLENIGEGKLVLKEEKKNKQLILVPLALGRKSSCH